MTFIEVLIAVVILVIGILGAVALQAVAMKSSFDSMQRSLASSLAQDIVERMRGNNPNAIANYQLGSPFGGGGAGKKTDCAAALPVGCTAAQLTANDLFEWEQALMGAGTKYGTSLVGGLVNGVGCIRVVDDNRVTVTISWQGRIKLAERVSSKIGKACKTIKNKRRHVVVNAFII